MAVAVLRRGDPEVRVPASGPESMPSSWQYTGWAVEPEQGANSTVLGPRLGSPTERRRALADWAAVTALRLPTTVTSPPLPAPSARAPVPDWLPLPPLLLLSVRMSSTHGTGVTVSTSVSLGAAHTCPSPGPDSEKVGPPSAMARESNSAAKAASSMGLPQEL